MEERRVQLFFFQSVDFSLLLLFYSFRMHQAINFTISHECTVSSLETCSIQTQPTQVKEGRERKREKERETNHNEFSIPISFSHQLAAWKILFLLYIPCVIFVLPLSLSFSLSLSLSLSLPSNAMQPFPSMPHSWLHFYSSQISGPICGNNNSPNNSNSKRKHCPAIWSGKREKYLSPSCRWVRIGKK